MSYPRRKGRAAGRSPRKGQFFLLGAFLVSALFFIGLPKNTPFDVETNYDVNYIMKNLQKEMPNAYNLGVAGGDFLGTMKNFTWFSGNVLRARRMPFGTLLFFGTNSSPTDFNVTVFNYLGRNQTVNITIGGTTSELFAANNQSNNTVFSGPGATFNISFKHAIDEKNVTWVRDKHSIYGVLNITRSSSVVITDFLG